MPTKYAVGFKIRIAGVVSCAFILNLAGLAGSHGAKDPLYPEASDATRVAVFSKSIEDLEEKLTKEKVKSDDERANAQFVYELAYVSKNFANWSDEASLNLRHTFITDVTFPYLARLSQLQSLNVSETLSSGEGLHYLSKLPNLRSLDLTGCVALRPQDSRVFSQFPALKVLNLNSTATDDRSLSDLAKVRSLQALRMNCTHVTGAGFRYLAKMPNLTELDVAGCQDLTREGFQSIGQISSLDELHVYNTHMGDDGLLALKNLKLKMLRALNAEVTDRGLAALRNMPLVKLMLSNNRITDAGVSELSGLPARALRLADNKGITDNSVETFLKMKSLNHLDVSGTAISQPARRRLELAGIDLTANDSSWASGLHVER